MDPIEKKVTSIVKGINGADPAKLKAINDINRGGGSGSSSSSSSVNINAPGQQQYIPAENKALAEQARTYYPALLQQEKALYKQRVDALKNLEAQRKSLALTEETYQKIVNAMTLVGSAEADNATLLKSFNEEMKRLGTNIKLEDLSMQSITQLLADQRKASKDAEESIQQIDVQMESLQKEISLAELGMSKFAKSFPKAAAAARVAAGMIKTALYSIGIGIIIAALVEGYNLIKKIIEKSREVQRTNKEIAQSTNQMSAKGIIALQELSNAYAKVGNSAEAKQKFLEQYAYKIRETGLAIDTVQEAEDVFVKNTSKYVEAIKNRAKAQAIEAELVKLYTDYMNDRYDLEQKLEKAQAKNRERRQARLKQRIQELDEDYDKRSSKWLDMITELETEYSKVYAVLEGTTSGGKGGKDKTD